MRASTLMKAALVALLCISVPAVAAGQTTINFDSLTCPTTSPFLTITNQFAGVGVSNFFGPTVCRQNTIGMSSPPNLVRPQTQPNAVSWDFSNPVPFAEIRPLDVGVNGLRLECFSGTGGGGASLGFALATPFAGDGNGTSSPPIRVTAAGIRSCIVSQVAATSPTDGYALDDLMFPVELQSFSIE